MNWDLNDALNFLAVARTGSTLAAAKSLGVNQTTCARRVAALETALGFALFERSPAGYRPTAGGAALVAPAEQIETAAAAMERAAQAWRREAQGEIRFSTSDVLADIVAGPAIARFARLRPEIRVRLHVDSRAVDLDNGEADVALRAGPEFDNPKLVARKVMDDPWAFYAAARESADPPRGVEDLAGRPLATLEGRPEAMLRAALPGADIRHVSNSMKALIEVIKGGDCVGALPMLVGEAEPGLARCFALGLSGGGLWIVFHERLREAPHLRAFVDHLAGFIREWRARLPGPAAA